MPLTHKEKSHFVSWKMPAHSHPRLCSVPLIQNVEKFHQLATKLDSVPKTEASIDESKQRITSALDNVNGDMLQT